MFYRINVALNGTHLFATADHSLTSEKRFLECLTILESKFPKSEGYSVTATRWDTVGTVIRDGTIEQP